MVSLFLLCLLPAFIKAEPSLKAYEVTANGAVRVWWDRFGTASKDFICYEPSLPSNEWKVLGQRGQQNHDALEKPIMAFKEATAGNGALASAIGFTFIWDDRYGTNIRDASAWRPQCPKDYYSVGDQFYPKNRIEHPGQDLYQRYSCVRKDLVEKCIPGKKVWDDGGSTSWFDISVWEPLPNETELGGFLFTNNLHAHPPNMQMYCLKHSSYVQVYNIDD